MKLNDIEKKLKTSADKIEITGFPEKWDAIQSRENFIDTNNDILIQKPVLINDSGNTTVYRNDKKLLVIIFSAFLACAIICLSIVLPIVLQKNDERVYFEADDLLARISSEYDFYDKLVETNIKVISFKEFEVESYILYYASDDILVGGGVELIDENNGYIAHINFYNEAVVVRDKLVDFEEYRIKDIIIKYTIVYEDELYSLTAIAQYNKLTYIIDCLSINDEILQFLDNLFS